MRSKLLLLVLAAGCDPTFDPAPPVRLPYTALAMAAVRDQTLIVTAAGEVETEGTPVPLPTASDGSTEPVLTLPPVLDVASGRDHACAIATTGVPFCWGDHTNGALGASRVCTADPNGGAPNCILDASPVSTLPAMRELAAGTEFTCGIAFDDRVFCWGRGGAWLGGAQVPAFAPPTPVLVDGQPLLASRLVGHASTMCAIDHAATAWCWGAAYGASPSRKLEGVIDLALGDRHNCAITAADGLFCWGDNTNGQCGDIVGARTCGNTCRVEATSIPLAARRVAVGERHTCALTTDSEVYCWGSNEVGQLGRTDAFLLGDLGLVVGNAVDLVAGYAHTCALTDGGSAWCWGAYLSAN
ncbi:MAG: hypothetical protein SFX73_09965 [Kofleriaceae bacterium]|nr:hypothetical protein [Kofleriaceae bacterium]